MRWNPTVVGGEITSLVLEAKTRPEDAFLRTVCETGEQILFNVVLNGESGSTPKLKLSTKTHSLPPKLVPRGSSPRLLEKLQRFFRQELSVKSEDLSRSSRKHYASVRLVPRTPAS